MATPLIQQPEPRLDDPANLCSHQFRPIVVEGILLSLLREHFSIRDQIEDPVIRAMIWVPDGASPPAGSSRLIIDVNTRWDPNLAQERPAIVLTDNGSTPLQMARANGNFGTSYVDEDGYSQFMQGSTSLLCLGREGGEAKRLAAEVYRYLGGFANQILRSFSFHAFNIAGVSGAAQIKEAHGSWGCTVQVRYAWADTWHIITQAPYLKRVEIDAVPAG